MHTTHTMDTPPRHHPLVRACFVAAGILAAGLAIGVTAYAITGLLARKVETQPVRIQGPEGIERIVIRQDRGSIILRGQDRSDVGGEQSVTSGLRAPTLTQRIEGRVLTLETSCFGFEASWCGVAYTLDVPATAAVDIESGTGSITLVGMRGAARVTTGAGSVNLVDPEGVLDLESGAGSIHGTGIRSSRVAAESGAGAVRLEFVNPPERILAESGAGSVDIVVPLDEVPYAVTSEEGVGAVEIGVVTSPTATRSIQANAGAGSVRIRYP